MNTIIIEHVDNHTTDLLKQLAEKLGLHVRAKKEKTEAGVVTNPEIMEAIAAYESRKTKPFDIDWETIKKESPNA